MAVTAKRMLLELFTAAVPGEAPASVLVQAAALFHLSETNVRVTLARLVAAGTLELTGRGMYRLGADAQALTKQVTSWRELEKQLRKWDGVDGRAFISAGSAGPIAPRCDVANVRCDCSDFVRSALRSRCAPTTSKAACSVLRERLDVARARRRGDRAPRHRARSANREPGAALWDGRRLTTGYRSTRERIDRWLVAAQDLAPQVAAREAFMFGGEVLRQILFDPRLPEPLVDVARAARDGRGGARLDTYGRRLWYRLFGIVHGMVVTTGRAAEHVQPETDVVRHARERRTCSRATRYARSLGPRTWRARARSSAPGRRSRRRSRCSRDGRIPSRSSRRSSCSAGGSSRSP